MYEIRLCKHEELDLLKSFLESSWSNTHIFLQDQTVLDFQHKSLEGYNFVVAYHKEQKRFHGVLGVVSPSFYLNKSISLDEDVWLAIWKVDKELAETNSLGMDLLNYIDSKFKPRTISAIGINETAALLYKLMGFKVRKMRQWFIPNSDYKEFKLIFGDIAAKKKRSTNSLPVVNLTSDDHELIHGFLSKNKVKKSFNYLVARYFNHPSYKYRVIGFCNEDDKLVALGVGREVSADNSKAFRLTELFFDNSDVQDLSSSFDAFMQSNLYEYMDFLEFGFDDLFLKKAGFISCSESLYVPHLFEPFVSHRTEVTIAYRSDYPFYCTKGDSDLDRPNSRLSNV